MKKRCHRSGGIFLSIWMAVSALFAAVLLPDDAYADNVIYCYDALNCSTLRAAQHAAFNSVKRWEFELAIGVSGPMMWTDVTYSWHYENFNRDTYTAYYNMRNGSNINAFTYETGNMLWVANGTLTIGFGCFGDIFGGGFYIVQDLGYAIWRDHPGDLKDWSWFVGGTYFMPVMNTAFGTDWIVFGFGIGIGIAYSDGEKVSRVKNGEFVRAALVLNSEGDPGVDFGGLFRVYFDFRFTQAFGLRVAADGKMTIGSEVSGAAHLFRIDSKTIQPMISLVYWGDLSK
ncbi:MAG: hypothetical protein IKY83_04895 [Proteobacteria bacterium]|nr:hypothetical protein [Pseudomonadota bacterium]